MSSYIESNKSYKNIKLLSYLIAKDYARDKESLKDEINAGLYKLYKNNVASVAIQYGDKIRFNTDDYYLKFEQEVLQINFIEEYPYLNNNLVLDLFNALKCIDYQIEIDYNKDFINKMEHYILLYLSRHTETPNNWGLEDLELNINYKEM